MGGSVISRGRRVRPLFSYYIRITSHGDPFESFPDEK